MSLEFIKEQLSDFISSTEPEVMAIQGEWGMDLPLYFQTSVIT